MQWRWPLVQQVSRLKAAGAMKEEGRAECGGPALYEDPDFRCVDASLFSGSSTPLARLQGDITWLRPQVSLSSRNAQKIPYWLSSHWSGVVIVKILPHRAWHLWPISLCRLSQDEGISLFWWLTWLWRTLKVTALYLTKINMCNYIYLLCCFQPYHCLSPNYYFHFTSQGDLPVTSSLPKQHQPGACKARPVRRLLVPLCVHFPAQEQTAFKQGNAGWLSHQFILWAPALVLF